MRGHLAQAMHQSTRTDREPQELSPKTRLAKGGGGGQGHMVARRHAPHLCKHALRVLWDDLQSTTSGSSSAKRALYGSLSWICYPLLEDGFDFLSTDVTIKLRINKEYKNYVATGANGGKPMYSWKMDDISTVTQSDDQLKSALDMINVVPNPYYAFSQYERTRLETKVKITNLPERCSVNIYTVNGKLVRSFQKDSPVTSLDWDLTNQKAIPIASGIYLIHVDVPGTGERVLKFFCGMRQVDLQGI